jgi:hypothetical protein
VIEGITKAESLFDISVWVIGVLDRTMEPEHEEEVLNFFIQNKETIIGIDIANDERFSCLPFAPLYKGAGEAGLGLTCHAGESTGGAPSVWDAVDGLKVTRVGHGFRAFEDPEVVELLVKREVVLEFCPIYDAERGISCWKQENNTVNSSIMVDWIDNWLAPQFTFNDQDSSEFLKSFDKEKNKFAEDLREKFNKDSVAW